MKKAVFSDMDEKERQFIKRINDKEEEGYRELFRRYYRYLVVVAHRYTQNVDDAEDITQDAIFNLWQSPRTFDSLYGLQHYLYTSVKNGGLRYLDRKRMEQRFADYMLSTSSEEDEDTKEYELMREEIYRLVHEAIDALPEGCRKIFREHLAGKKNEEIAKMFRLSVDTVKNQKKNALRLLRNRLSDLSGLMLLIATQA